MNETRKILAECSASNLRLIEVDHTELLADDDGELHFDDATFRIHQGQHHECPRCGCVTKVADIENPYCSDCLWDSLTDVIGDKWAA